MNIHINRLQTAPQLDQQTSAFALEALEGLTQTPKTLSPKYFYDVAGSDLFEQITLLPEYYPTRTELGILRDRGARDRQAHSERRGAGGIRRRRDHEGAAAVEELFVRGLCAGRYLRRIPAAAGQGPAAGFSRARRASGDRRLHASFELPADVRDMPKVGFFPGSTIGNFEPQEASRFLRRAAEILGKGALLILGVDLEKDEARAARRL